MNGYLTTKRYKSLVDLPISLAQTELRRGRYVTCGQVLLTLGQVMRIRCLNLHLIGR